MQRMALMLAVFCLLCVASPAGAQNIDGVWREYTIHGILVWNDGRCVTLGGSERRYSISGTSGNYVNIENARYLRRADACPFTGNEDASPLYSRAFIWSLSIAPSQVGWRVNADNRNCGGDACSTTTGQPETWETELTTSGTRLLDPVNAYGIGSRSFMRAEEQARREAEVLREVQSFNRLLGSGDTEAALARLDPITLEPARARTELVNAHPVISRLADLSTIETWVADYMWNPSSGIFQRTESAFISLEMRLDDGRTGIQNFVLVKRDGVWRIHAFFYQ